MVGSVPLSSATAIRFYQYLGLGTSGHVSGHTRNIRHHGPLGYDFRVLTNLSQSAPHLLPAARRLKTPGPPIASTLASAWLPPPD